MTDNFDFSTAKQVRKTLLITSFTGIFFTFLIKNSTGNFEFLFFKIPVEDATLITNFIAIVIMYLIVVFYYRKESEYFKENYSKWVEDLNSLSFSTSVNPNMDEIKRILDDKVKKNKSVSRVLKFIDTIFPILFGLLSILIIIIYNFILSKVC
ncbi:hypothetical protein [Mesonia sp. K4-1]|uniref:hypothetical protein n=1 Tax=Mesonia sp. K4-1 TaxID=2602760 RepID=UPI0011C71372|nr:hypothetical protein [Mesonia sp. K4-1]TXK78690.1 hypothetical protein FT986_02535 [Mesonia sp. K4-1]